MSESSDENSFAWTNTSKSSEDSDLELKLNAETISNMAESESEKNYKKKLHSKLFANNDEETEAKVKVELMNSDCVKREPDDGNNSKPRKRKRKRDSTSGSEGYLQKRVKLEEATLNNNSLEKHIDTSQSNVDDTDAQETKRKKKKSKKSRSFQENNEVIKNEEQISIEETVENYENEVVHKKSKKKHKKKDKTTYNGETCLDQNNDDLNHMDANNGSIEGIRNHRHDTTSDISSPPHGVSEQELESETHQENYSSQSLQMKRFFKANPHLCPIKNKKASGPLISKDDDIWLLNCPHDVDAHSFKGIEMSLDTKFKVKLNDQNYVGGIENDASRIAVLMFKGKKPNLMSLPLTGRIHLRKRIPKANVIQDSFLVNDQPDFIPLPATKCRHPLFGADYKKAIKIPSSVKSRLEEPCVEEVEFKKKKKHKKHKSKDMEKDQEEHNEVDGLEQSARESRKRRRSSRSSPPAHLMPKRSKSQAASPEVWDSKQAIEDNLFKL